MDLVQASVDNQVTRHDAALRALGLETDQDDALWRGLDDGGEVLLAAIVRRAGVDPGTVVPRIRELIDRRNDPVWVCDSYADIDLSSLGLVQHDAEPWYAREATQPPEEEEPPDFTIQTAVSEAALSDFHAVASRAFGGDGSIGTIYAPALLDDPRFYFAVRRENGAPVAAATAVIANGVVGIYDVGTVPEARGRGYGYALTLRALSLAPFLPAVLQPSPMGAAMYQRLGFTEIGTFRRWSPPSEEGGG